MQIFQMKFEEHNFTLIHLMCDTNSLRMSLQLINNCCLVITAMLNTDIFGLHLGNSARVRGY